MPASVGLHTVGEATRPKCDRRACSGVSRTRKKGPSSKGAACRYGWLLSVLTLFVMVEIAKEVCMGERGTFVQKIVKSKLLFYRLSERKNVE